MTIANIAELKEIEQNIRLVEQIEKNLVKLKLKYFPKFTSNANLWKSIGTACDKLSKGRDHDKYLYGKKR
jgi:hypothetical protein